MILTDSAIQALRLTISSSICGINVISASRSIGPSFILRMGSTKGDNLGRYVSEWRVDILSAKWIFRSRGKEFLSKEIAEIDDWPLAVLPTKIVVEFDISTDGSMRMEFEGDHQLIVSDGKQAGDVSWMISFWNYWLVTQKDSSLELETLQNRRLTN